MPRDNFRPAEKHSSMHYKNNGQILKRIVEPTKLTHLIAFNIKENNNLISGILTIEFDYYSSDGRIKYSHIQYSDPRLIKHIEGNPIVMKNIDSYIRKNLLESEYGFKL
ncbi:MAG: hypothetical protein E6L03_08115 [Thaumarchaeota archaeon]|nr:MAG: hypothetical protein E6L03_08115 [Nitrososphaerota archaeon]